MYQKLVNLNDDIKRLVEKGYAVGFDSNYMIIRDIPYLNQQRQLQIGTIVTKLVYRNNNHVEQEDHQIFFAGDVPCNVDGSHIKNLGGGATHLALSESCEGVVVQRSFSNKPKSSGKFEDFFDKIESYVSIICGPAIELHNADPLTYRRDPKYHEESVFKIADTMTSRAEITDLSAKFKHDVVAIIGLGGTGSYVLDHLVKVPVKEIRGFDKKAYRVHNAFRSSGKMDLEEFGASKAEVYQARYDNFRHGINLIPENIDVWSAEKLEEVTFAFVCVDNGPARSDIFDLLISLKIPFIDVGMGVKRKNGLLNGMLRVTYFPIDQARKMRDMGLCDLDTNPEDLYKTNIQTGELNSINGGLAVVKYKQVRGFYYDDDPLYNLLFEVADLKIVGSSYNE